MATHVYIFSSFIIVENFLIENNVTVTRGMQAGKKFLIKREHRASKMRNLPN